MTTAEIGNRLVSLCRDSRFVDAVDELYGDHTVSVEAADFQGMGREMSGKPAIRAKNQMWLEANQVHEIKVTGPFVSPEKFAVLFHFDWTRKATGERVRMAETAVYTVENGKIVREEFLYGS